MTASFLQRYQQGENEQVWHELSALGEQVRAGPCLTDAQAVMIATMQRARHNVALIIERLHLLEYQFAYPDQSWVPANDHLTARLNAFEQRYGLLPLSFYGWWAIVGTVNLMGYHPKLSTYAGDFGCSSVMTYADPLVVEFEDIPEDNFAEEDECDDTSAVLFFAPCYFHKSNFSGSGGVYFDMPNSRMDAILRDDANKWTGIPFVSHLRTCFKWGGFAGFEESVVAQAAAAEELAFLTEGLLPL
jgi:hypothetical protein